MVVLNQRGSDDPRMYDLSFMYSKRCNLSCSFCMYNSSPTVDDAMDLVALRSWLETVDMNQIASFGIYGGEPSINLNEYARIMDMLAHLDKPHFIITNGSWSRDYDCTMRFLEFCAQYRMHIVVSGTPEHRAHQDRTVLEWLAKQEPGAFRLKPEEENFHPMGRLVGKMPFSCSRKCMSWNRALRVAVQPDGSIIFQNCDGVYPVVGNIREPFRSTDERVQQMRINGFAPACCHYERSLPERIASAG
jgi:hypothetical protein